MTQPSLKQLARELGLSSATVSRALHNDPRVREETREKVLAIMTQRGYQMDPVVSDGMSRVRRRTFYRETIAWCADEPRPAKDWLHPMLESAEAFGKTSGYNFDYFTVDPTDTADCQRLARIWKARGIHGVIFLPFRKLQSELSFPWDSMCWVKIGHSILQPRLHEVGRDYHTDLSVACEWLAQQGCHRPGFACYRERDKLTIFSRPLLEFSVTYYHGKSDAPTLPYRDLSDLQAPAIRAWLSGNRFDSLILPDLPPARYKTIHAFIQQVPTVLLSPPDSGRKLPPRHLSFIAPYQTAGEAAVNMMHRLLRNKEVGIPPREHRLLMSSDRWTTEALIAS